LGVGEHCVRDAGDRGGVADEGADLAAVRREHAGRPAANSAADEAVLDRRERDDAAVRGGDWAHGERGGGVKAVAIGPTATPRFAVVIGHTASAAAA
jgi:hypothetical protein